MKGKSDIGDQINKRIIAPLAKENKLAKARQVKQGMMQELLTGGFA